jgi:4-amino-4-deoxy-L-arabinose transferase-like glycosyltransferase
MKRLLRADLYLIVLILIICFLVRLYKIDNPLADWHSWRQSDTSAVSRNFILNGFDLLHPHFEDLSNVPSGKDNPLGYRFVEFPIYNLAQGGFYLLFKTFSLEIWGRLVSVLSSVIATYFIYALVKRKTDVYVALFSAFFYAVLPFSIYYGRTILPDSLMVTAILGGIYFFDLWIEENVKCQMFPIRSGSRMAKTIGTNFQFILAIIFTASALLLKPYAIFFTLPMVYLAFQKYKFKMLFKWQLWLFLIISIMPLMLWRVWMMRYPEGIPVYDWLFNGGDIRFKGAFFYWLFADRMGRLILGYWGISLLIIGLLVNSGKKQLKTHGIFFYTFLLSSIIYMFVIARGNVQHDYYQILIIPSVVIFMGLGARALLFPHPDYINSLFSRLLLGVIIGATLVFGWYNVRDYYNINNPSILTAGIAADKLLPKSAKVIALYDGDTTFLYQTKRNGWASLQNPLPEMINKGATYLIIVNPTKKDLEIGKQYPIITNTKEYVIFGLK